MKGAAKLLNSGDVSQDWAALAQLLGQLPLVMDLVVVLLGETLVWTDTGVGSVITSYGLGRCVAREDTGLD